MDSKYHARARSANNALPAKAIAAFDKPRGRPAGSDKEKVSIRLDRDILDRLRAGGPGWQGRVNAALRRAVTEGSLS